MQGVAFVLLGVVILWLFPGAVAATVCLLRRRLRDRAIQLSRYSARKSVATYAQRARASPEDVRRRLRIPDSRAFHLVSAILVLTVSGPHAFRLLSGLARGGTETQLE